MGLKGSITTMVEWSVDNNNLFKEISVETSLGSKELRLQCNDGNNVYIPTHSAM
jgi:hypothetical protein